MAKDGKVARSRNSLPSDTMRNRQCSSLGGLKLDPVDAVSDGRNSCHVYEARRRGSVRNKISSDGDSRGSDTSVGEQCVSDSSFDSEIHESMFGLEDSFGEETETRDDVFEFSHFGESEELFSPKVSRTQFWELIKKFKIPPSIEGDGSLGQLVGNFQKTNPEIEIVHLKAIPRVVNSIVDCRFQNGERQFLVHWEDRSCKHDSWKTEEVIKSAARPALSLQISDFFLKRGQNEDAWEYFRRYVRTAFSNPNNIDYLALSRLANEKLSIKKDCVILPKWADIHRMRVKIAKLLKMKTLLDGSQPKLNQFIEFGAKRFEAISRYQKWSNEISKMEPRAEIGVENFVDCEDPPWNFIYITDLIVEENVDVESPKKFCKCQSGNCLDTNCCGRHASPSVGSVKAYRNGRLTNECSAVPLYECNSKCACGLSCQNRLIQHGSQVKLTIFKTINRGWGVETRTSIPRGTFIGEYVGELMTSLDAQLRHSVNFTFLFDLTPKKGKPAKYTIDAAKFGNFTRFFNHSCDPNMRVSCAFIDNHNKDAPRIAFFAKKDISCGEELTFDYNMHTTGDSGHLSPIACLCGAKKCREFLFRSSLPIMRKGRPIISERRL